MKKFEVEKFESTQTLKQVSGLNSSIKITLLLTLKAKNVIRSKLWLNGTQSGYWLQGKGQIVMLGPTH